MQIVPFRDSKRVRLKNKKQFQELHEAASKSSLFHPDANTMSYRCCQFLSPMKLLCILNDRTSKRAYFGIYVLSLEKAWTQLRPRALPSQIKSVTSMDVCHSRRMIAVGTSDMNVNIFGMDTFSVYTWR